ncbi:MAG: sugar ABC transporter ATP-binding protein [Treponema sp.]|nr:sugar ABC transporter ATP-binding protein [Treponema sp.]
MTGEEIILEARNITKTYPGTIALDDVTFKVRKGKVNVLIGENGAGKSTLMKIVAGVEVPTEGKIFINGEEVLYTTPSEALEHGVGMIHQELNLFPNMNIAENIYMTREIKKNPVSINHKKQIEEAKKYLDRLQLFIEPTTLVKDLRAGQQQIVEICKVLSQKSKIIIMDEPTSSLSQGEVSILFNIINDLTKSGVTIIYISHRLEEIMTIGDYITILRDGHFIAEEEVKNIDIPWIIAKMTNNNKVHRIESNRVPGEEILRVEHLSLPKNGGGYILKDVSFVLHRNEILGIYGLRGAGRTELLECLIGAQPNMEGEIYLEGKKVVSKTIAGRIKDGFSLIPEDRKNLGILANLSIEKNMTISNLERFTRKTIVSNKEEDLAVKEMVRNLQIKLASTKNLITSLSGGNQQKVIIGKSLLTNVKVLLMDEPTRGIDVGAKHDVFTICNKLAGEGFAVIFVSSEMQEILAVPDRTIVLSGGKLNGEFSCKDVTQEKLVKASALDLNASE